MLYFYKKIMIEKDIKVGDFIRYKGKSISSVTKGKNYTVIKKYLGDRDCIIEYLDNHNNKKNIILNNKNLWCNKFVFDIKENRREKIKKLNL